jgi:hypothetical protein
MSANLENKDQQHPLYKRDRAIVDRLLADTASDRNLAELARLRIRYRGFPGARDIQADLDQVMQAWGLTEDALYEKTRQIHATSSIYQGAARDEEDWS